MTPSGHQVGQTGQRESPGQAQEGLAIGFAPIPSSIANGNRLGIVGVEPVGWAAMSRNCLLTLNRFGHDDAHRRLGWNNLSHPEPAVV